MITQSSAISHELFDVHTGMIQPHFKHQLDLVGVMIHAHFPNLPLDHIRNVDATLQTNGCFQRDVEFYKKKNISTFKITYDQAVHFLEDEFASMKTEMPRERKKADAIFVCGVEATMHKRFKSLIKSLKKGYEYSKIHFIVQNNQPDEMNNIASDRQVLNQLISNTYQDCVKHLEINTIIVEPGLNFFERGLEALKSSSKLSHDYVIISDPSFASKVEKITANILFEHHCLGVASARLKDWRQDVIDYGYTEEIFGSFEQAVIARVCSLWNFKARQVHTELEALNRNMSVGTA